MLEKLYFWKGGGSGVSLTLRILLALLIVILLVCGGGAAYWYYYIKVPADEAHVRQQQAADQLKADINAVKNWYEKALEGGSIDFGITLLDELHRAYLPLRRLNMRMKSASYSCTLKMCQTTIMLDTGVIVTQPEIEFFGKKYQASFPLKKGKGNSGKNAELLYGDMKVESSKNKLLDNYKKGKELSLYACNDIVSYIESYNSVLSANKWNNTGGVIVYKKLPSSSVSDKARKLAGQVKSYDMLSAEWSMEINSDNRWDGKNEISAQIALYKQAYREAFLIRKIETIKNGIKVSGGFVCKA